MTLDHSQGDGGSYGGRAAVSERAPSSRATHGSASESACHHHVYFKTQAFA